MRAKWGAIALQKKRVRKKSVSYFATHICHIRLTIEMPSFREPGKNEDALLLGMFTNYPQVRRT
jgi:hypothetical protein